jgi:hypothetical protein
VTDVYIRTIEGLAALAYRARSGYISLLRMTHERFGGGRQSFRVRFWWRVAWNISERGPAQASFDERVEGDEKRHNYHTWLATPEMSVI